MCLFIECFLCPCESCPRQHLRINCPNLIVSKYYVPRGEFPVLDLLLLQDVLLVVQDQVVHSVHHLRVLLQLIN